MRTCYNCNIYIGALGRPGYRISENYGLCRKCLKKGGFSINDMQTGKYDRFVYSIPKKTKAECDEELAREEYLREHTRRVTFRLKCDGKNMDGVSIQKILKTSPKKYIDPGDLHGGMLRKSDFSSASYGQRYYIFEDSALDVDLVEEDGTVRVYFDGQHIGDLPEAAEILHSVPDAERKLVVTGGKFKVLDAGANADRLLTGEEPYGAEIRLKWIE